tara:strand:+ start:453 stop:950 length:498 start_codon:yes stop_codon:yes gene_type:complete
MMNERTFKWELTPGLVIELVSLDKEARRDFFTNLPIENVPMGSLMDISKVEVDDKGQVTFTVTPQEFHYNPLGTVHGGLAATMLDSCNSISANCQLDKGFITMTTDLRVNFFRPMTVQTGAVTATAKIEKIGRKVIFVTGTLQDKGGKIYATANSTELVVDFPPK